MKVWYVIFMALTRVTLVPLTEEAIADTGRALSNHK